MKKLIIKTIRFYQKHLSQYTPHCLYVPSCSEYCILAIEKYGLWKGLAKAKARFDRCTAEHIHEYGTIDYP